MKMNIKKEIILEMINKEILIKMMILNKTKEIIEITDIIEMIDLIKKKRRVGHYYLMEKAYSIPFNKT